MTNKKIIANFFYQASYQLLVVMMPIITVPIVSRALQPDGVGTWNYVNSIVSYFTLIAGLGLSSYGVREIAFVKSNKETLSKKFWEIQGFNVFFSFSVLIVYIIYSLNARFSNLFLIQSMVILATLFDISWFFQGIEEFKKISIINMLIKVFTLVMIVIFIRTKDDLPIYALIMGGSSLLSGMAFWLFISKKIYFVRVSVKSMWKHFAPALSFFVVKMASTLFNNLNKTLLGMLTTMSVLGIFSNSLVLVSMITTIFNSLNIVLLPRMSSLEKEKDEKTMILVLTKAIDIQVFLTTGCMFVTIGVVPSLIGWFFGESFLEVTKVVPILAPVMLLGAIQQAIANMYLVPKDKIRSFAWTIVVGTVINTAICLLLIPKYGAYGAAIGYTVGQCYLALSRVIILIKETTFRLNIKKIFFCIVSGFMALLAIKAIGFISIDGILLTIIQGTVGVVTYFICTLFFMVNPMKTRK